MQKDAKKRKSRKLTAKRCKKMSKRFKMYCTITAHRRCTTNKIMYIQVPPLHIYIAGGGRACARAKHERHDAVAGRRARRRARRARKERASRRSRLPLVRAHVASASPAEAQLDERDDARAIPLLLRASTMAATTKCRAGKARAKTERSGPARHAGNSRTMA